MQVLFQLSHDDFQYHFSGWFLCHLPSGSYLDQNGLRLRDDGRPCKTRTECRGGGLTEAKEHHHGSSVAQSPVGVLCPCNVHDHSALRHPCTVRVDDIRARAAYRRAFPARLVLHLSRYAKGSPHPPLAIPRKDHDCPCALLGGRWPWTWRFRLFLMCAAFSILSAAAAFLLMRRIRQEV